jgi:hypothetical protein
MLSPPQCPIASAGSAEHRLPGQFSLPLRVKRLGPRRLSLSVNTAGQAEFYPSTRLSKIRIVAVLPISEAPPPLPDGRGPLQGRAPAIVDHKNKRQPGTVAHATAMTLWRLKDRPRCTIIPYGPHGSQLTTCRIGHGPSGDGRFYWRLRRRRRIVVPLRGPHCCAP